MRRVRKFLRLEAGAQLLYLQALLLLGALRLGLWLLPFNILQRVIAGMARPAVQPPQTKTSSIGRIASAVRVASRFVPQATCLPQALATQLLAGRRGYPVRLQIGVSKSEEGRLQAHAWVDSPEAIVMGNLADLSRFEPLPLLFG